MTRLVKRVVLIVASAAILSGSFLHSAFAQATSTGTTFIYAYYNRDFTAEAAINSYAKLGNASAVRVVGINANGLNAQQLQQKFSEAIASNPAATYMGAVVGHGDPTVGSNYLAANFTRDGAGSAWNNALNANGAKGWWAEDSCGSGACTGFFNPDANSAIQGVFTSTKPGVVGNDTNFGNGWLSDYGESYVKMLSNAGTGGSNDPDLNHNGILTGKEAGEYLNKINPGTYKLAPGAEDRPMWFATKELAEKYLFATECIILRPGQVDESYTGSAQNTGEVKVEFKPTSISGYGSRTQNPEAFPVLGTIRDTTTTNESELNFDLRRLGSYFVEKNVTEALASPVRDKGIKKKIIILPNAAQAKEFVQSLGGNPNAQGYYTVDGMKLSAGKHYLTNNPDPQDKVRFDDVCTPKEWSPPSPTPTTIPSYDPSRVQNAPTQGSGSGLEALLPALLQSLLGGGQNQGQQNGQNQNGTGAPQTQACASQGIYPVCASNGVTYTNSCYLQQNNVVQISTGVCPSASPSPISTPDISKIVTQLIASGTPQGVLSSIIQSLTSLFSHATGQVMVQ